MTRVMVFGASITYGAWDLEGGWADRLKKFIHEKTLSDPGFHCFVYNQGISGDITEDVLERFEFETKMRMKEGEDTVLIFSIGANDSYFVHSQNSRKTSPEKFSENISKLINLARKTSPKIVFVGLTPMDESKTTPISWDHDKSYKNEYLKEYNEIVKSVCRENKVLFIELFDKLSGTEFMKTLDDGVHPDSRGHEMIFKIIRDFLVENKII